ncbi:cystathionine gamma-synthase [Periconia macrospinosa]|uniref:Cystathionine gamma-synthase n=1 Tax=Periconia macrospinosa TaxID=97972 RepID=A0A2V1DW52_9PLEO|nr:cystathionine gamma-synthase [Periconia macrospinosa]
MAPLQAATSAIHADDCLNTLTDVAPAIHTSTTFRYPRNASNLQPVPVEGEYLDIQTPLVYSRLTSSNINRLETILTPLIFPTASVEGDDIEQLSNHVVSYTSGLSAFHALLVNVVPKVIAISEGYHGCHGVVSLHSKMHGLRTVDLHADEAAWDAAGLGKGDIVHLETPLNPTGEAFSIKHYADRAHARGALLSVDATFGPPGLQDPFAWGADIVMHSGTKYIGGHSDMLCGILAVKRGEVGKAQARALREERVFLGSVMGSLEGWLGVRSLRTMELRVQRQSRNAGELVKWINEALTSSSSSSEVELLKKVVSGVTHASLQAVSSNDSNVHTWLPQQMPNGYGPVFAFTTHTAQQARRLPSHLRLFHHATSLGGVESLIEWRRMSDSDVDPRLLRVSVGVENWEDLKEDLMGAFRALVEGEETEERERRGEFDAVTGEKGARVEGGAANGSI